MASFMLAILLSVPAQAQQSADPGVVADLVIQVQELQDEVRTLRGRLEEQERETESLRQRQRDQYLDLDQRLTGQRAGPSAADPDADRAFVEPEFEADEDVAVRDEPAPFEDVPEVRPPMDVPSETAGLGTPVVQSRAVAATPENEKAAYDKAFQSLKDLRYADSADQFRAFLDQYPDSAWADNAQYWLGESYYVTRNYEIALSAFNELMQRFPGSPKAPDALLKVGYTHYELKQWDQARAALTEVTEKYPGTTLSRLAESRLRSMRMEGHY